jgi:ech hydrogenase subunit C
MGIISKSRIKSPWVIHVNCTACNGCDIEVVAALTPVYDLERFGIVNVGNPKHADVMLVTGVINNRTARIIKNLYDQMPEPKAVVAIGACGGTGGIFAECYNVIGGIDKVVPVDAYVPGCPPRPEALIDAVVAALGKMEEKAQQMKQKARERKAAHAREAKANA